jgi:hypothetical protein
MRQLFFYLTLTAEEAGAWKSGELVNDRDGDGTPMRRITSPTTLATGRRTGARTVVILTPKLYRDMYI